MGRRATISSEGSGLRLAAILVCVIQLFLASAIPAVEYGLVLRYDNLGLGPWGWTNWAVATVVAVLGVVAHWAGSSPLLALHAAGTAMLGGALAGFDTAFWYTLNLRCSLVPLAFRGCGQAGCACATAGACTAAELAAPGCAGCAAYGSELCSASLQGVNYYLQAFMGLAALAAMAVPALLSLLALVRREARAGVRAARAAAVAAQVEAQADLVKAGEKPGVTPAMLTSWVELLLASGDEEAGRVAAACCEALAARGYRLPVGADSNGTPRGSKGQAPSQVHVQASTPGGGSGTRVYPASPGTAERGVRGGSPSAPPGATLASW